MDDFLLDNSEKTHILWIWNLSKDLSIDLNQRGRDACENSPISEVCCTPGEKGRLDQIENKGH